MPASTVNAALAGRFRRAATILELRGDAPFKANAFARVAATLESLPDDVRALHEGGGRQALEALDGVGRSSAAIVVDVLETGRSSDLDELARSVPSELLEMLELPGMGPKTVRRVWHERGVETLADLAAAIDDGSLATLKGLGRKTLERIGEGLALREAARGRHGLGVAVKLADALRPELEAIGGVERVALAGDARRGCETVAELELVLASASDADPAAILRAFGDLAAVDEVLELDGTTCRARVGDGPDGGPGSGTGGGAGGGPPVRVRVVPGASFGAALCLATGSEAHVEHLRRIAREGGRALESLAREGEEAFYAALGLAWVPPELREGAGEVELAARRELPAPVELGDVRGDLHCHTLASDGTATIVEMAEAARALGHAYLAITDHSVSQRQANGLDAKRLAEHVVAVREANERIDGIELLAGTECDILADGRLDYDDTVLSELDWVIASPHVALRQDGAKATERLLRAIDNPYVNAIGHPTGRLIDARPGLPLDFDAVFAAAAASGTALEINASYRRLDLSAERARAAVAAGCTLTIDTDAHTVAGLARLDGGLATARRGGVRKSGVLNCRALAEVRAFVARKRPR